MKMDTVWNPEKETIRSWMVKIEAYRDWYASLSRLEKVMMQIDGLPQNCRIEANIAVQTLIELVGRERANQMMDLVMEEAEASEPMPIVNPPAEPVQLGLF